MTADTRQVVSESKVEEIHAKSKIVKVALEKLRIDYSYQRDTSEKIVDAIANDWDVVASELILVSDRGTRSADGNVEGGMFIVNGQHRSKAAMKKGLSVIDARVIDLTAEDDPARIEAAFRLKTNVRLPDRPLERFKAQLRAGNDESLAIVAVLERFDTFINPEATADIGINCVATIEQIYRLDNGALLRDTLEIVRDTWTNVGGQNTKSALLKGICWFVEKHADESDRTRLVTRLKALGPSVLEARARAIGLTMGGAMWVNYYRAMVDVYNDGLRESKRLHWMLRGSTALNKERGRPDR